MSSLRKYQIDPKHLLNSALTMYRSKKIRTAVVEGVCDKRFLSQWIPPNTAIRFDGLAGKKLVNTVYTNSQSKPYSNYDFLYFCADVDFDLIANKKLNTHPKFVYNAYCLEEDKLHYNDLETYLVNTSAFEKVLVNLDIDISEASDLRERLERASRIIGSLRAADIIVQQTNKLRSSVLNGLEVKAFFNSHDISFNQTKLFEALPNWSSYREYTDELVEAAKRLDRESPLSWSLSRGHDLTEMLALHLECRGQKGISAEKLELMLRLACEFAEFQKSPMGKRLATSWGMMAFSPDCKGQSDDRQGAA